MKGSIQVTYQGYGGTYIKEFKDPETYFYDDRGNLTIVIENKGPLYHDVHFQLRNIVMVEVVKTNEE